MKDKLQLGDEALRTVAVFHVELLRGQHGEIFFLFAFVFAEFDATNDLLVDEIRRDGIFHRIVPGSKNFFPGNGCGNSQITSD